MTNRTIRQFTKLCALSFTVALGSDGSVALAVDPVINEIRVGMPGLDLSEYIEIVGTPGAALDGLTLIVIGDDDAAAPPSQNGTIEAVVALSGNFSSTGFFLVAESTFALPATPNQIAILNFEDPDNVTFLLVSGFTGTNGQDLDTNNDGTLDILPWTAIISSVALVQNATPNGKTADFVYSATKVGPDGASSPSQVWRCTDSQAWTIGSSDIAAGTDTPGAANPTCGGAVAIRISELRLDQPGNDDDEYFELQGPAGFDMNGYTFLAIGDNNTAGAVDLNGSIESITPLDGAIIPASGYLLVAKATMTIAVPDFIVAATAMNFENSDNVTFMLVTGFTGLLNDDVDTDNDCTLNATLPWSSVIDSVALVGMDLTCAYSTAVVGPDTSFTTAHAYRCFPEETWSIGAFNHLAGGDTPGSQNRACSAGPVLECGEASAGLCSVIHSNPYCSDSVCCTLICSTQPTCCSVSWDAACVAAAATSCGQTGTASCDRAIVSFSEIRIDQPSTDTDEWVELRGTAGTSMADMTIIVIGDGAATAGSGVIEAIVSLAGQTMPSSGRFAISEATFTQGIANIDLVLPGANPLNFENRDNVTFMLVQGFTGVNAQDCDSNDDGVFDAVVPWTSVLDTIALIKTTTLPPVGTEWYYGPNRIGPDGTFVPGHIWRCEDTGCWNIGLFDIVAAHDDTPGMPNANCGLPCAGDLNLDGAVDAQDLSAVLANWNGSGEGDVNQDGLVDGLDLAAILANWGPCS